MPTVRKLCPSSSPLSHPDGQGLPTPPPISIQPDQAVPQSTRAGVGVTGKDAAGVVDDGGVATSADPNASRLGSTV